MLLAFTWPPEAYLWFKTLHIVGVVVWFAGLFYLVRLFIYHREAAERRTQRDDVRAFEGGSERGGEQEHSENGRVRVHRSLEHRRQGAIGQELERQSEESGDD